MNKTQAELEAENAALRDLLAAIGEAMPPLPADPGKMNLYGLEASSRLSMATGIAGSLAACREDYLIPYAQEEAAALRESWAKPLHYERELAAPGDCACGHRGKEHIYTAPSPCTECGCLAFSAAAGADGTPAPQVPAPEVSPA